MQANDAVFEGPIVSVNRGGAIVMVEVCFVSSEAKQPVLPSNMIVNVRVLWEYMIVLPLCHSASSGRAY